MGPPLVVRRIRIGFNYDASGKSRGISLIGEISNFTNAVEKRRVEVLPLIFTGT